MAGALAVVSHAPAIAQPVLRAAAFSAFGAGLKIACIVGAGMAVAGAAYAFRFLPGRRVPEQVTAFSPGRVAIEVDPASSGASTREDEGELVVPGCRTAEA
jgi:hypothetical protein